MIEERNKRSLDKILVVDIEATCWQGKKPDDQESEIIEIGICELDLKTLKRSNKNGLIIKPENSAVSEFCTELTSLTQNDVDKGIKLEEACDIIRNDYYSQSYIWSSYGEYDHQMFRKECHIKKVKYPFSNKHIDLKVLFAVLQGLPKPVGMKKALNICKIELEGTHHRGVDDAWNIANILAHMLKNYRLGLSID